MRWGLVAGDWQQRNSGERHEGQDSRRGPPLTLNSSCRASSLLSRQSFSSLQPVVFHARPKLRAAETQELARLRFVEVHILTLGSARETEGQDM